MIETSLGSRIAALDVLRVIAVAGVVMAHFIWSQKWVTENLGGMPETIFGDVSGIAAYGFLGVHLFFIISGTVISRSAIGRTSKGFVIARFLRLMPTLFIAVVLSAVLLVARGELNVLVALRSIPTNLVLTPSLADTGWLNPVFWTLLVEASFYGIVGLLVLIWGSSRQVLWRFAWIWLGVTVVLSRIEDGTIHAFTLFDWSPFFIIGILIGTAETRSDRVLASIGIVASSLLAVDSTLETMNPEGRSVNIIFLVVFLMAVLVACSVWFRPVARLQSSKWAFVGTMTYALYLFHVIPGRVIAEHLLGEGWPILEAYVVALSSTVILSYVVTKFAEPPIRRLLKSAISS